MKEVTLHNKSFSLFKTKGEIHQRTKEIALELNKLKSENSMFISVLNGSFMFTSDLCKEIDFLPEIQFIKVKSYEGLNTTGKVKEVIGLTESIEGKTIFLIEDIIDTGTTISALKQILLHSNPKEVHVVTLLFKPGKYKGNENLNPIVGFEINDDFVVGYGMDYNELGRNLKDIYVVK